MYTLLKEGSCPLSLYILNGYFDTEFAYASWKYFSINCSKLLVISRAYLAACHRDPGVYNHGVLVRLVPHDLHAAVVVADEEGRLGRFQQPVLPVVPGEVDHSGHGPAAGQAPDTDLDRSNVCTKM